MLNKEKDKNGNIKNYVIANYGLDPKLGKYHRTYCDNCKSLSEIKDEKCIKCNSKKISKGVYDRIKEIEDRKEISKKAEIKNNKYIYQIPLEFLPGIGPKTLNDMLETFGTEMNILHHIEIDNIEAEFNLKIVNQIKDLREGKLKLKSGGGIYGKVEK